MRASTGPPPVKFRSSGKIITFDYSLRIGKGGEGAVYEVPGEPLLVAKIYHVSQVSFSRGYKLDVMVKNPPDDPMRAKGHASIAWPMELLELARTRQVAGFIMPRIEFGMKPVIDFYDAKTRILNHTAFTYNYLLRAATNLASAVRALHAKGYVIGDVNESNVVVNRNTALVTIIDTDSFQVNDPITGVTYRCPVGKEDFTPPELQGQQFANINREREHDLFGMGVIIFQLLMEGTPPFAGIYSGPGEPPEYGARIARGFFPYAENRRVPIRPGPLAPPFAMLNPVLQRLFLRCFEDGHTNPKGRPTADAWYQALRISENSLISCSTNGQHFFWNHLNECPWCERAKRLPDSFPTQGEVKSVRTSLGQRPKPYGTNIQVPMPPIQLPPTISRFYASHTAVVAGSGCTLHWSVLNAQIVSINNGVGNVPLTGSYTVRPTNTTTYVLTAYGPGGTTTRSVTIVVSQPSPISQFRALPNPVTFGKATTISWSVSQGYVVTISGGIGNVSAAGQFSVVPLKTKTFVLTAQGTTGREKRHLQVTVTLPPQAGPLSPTIPLLQNAGLTSGSRAMLQHSNLVPFRVRLNNYYRLLNFDRLTSGLRRLKQPTPITSTSHGRWWHLSPFECCLYAFHICGTAALVWASF